MPVSITLTAYKKTRRLILFDRENNIKPEIKKQNVVFWKSFF